MEEYKTVIVEDSTDRAASTFAIVIFAIIAAVVIGLLFWQPWASVPASGGTTTIIKETQAEPSKDTTIIVPTPSTPAPAPNNTEINIKTEPNNSAPPVSEPPAGEPPSSEPSSTGGDTASGGN